MVRGARERQNSDKNTDKIKRHILNKHRRSPSRCKHRAFGNGGRAPANAPVLRVGADCAGLNLGCVALEILGVRPDLIFASENDKATRAMTKHNFPIAPPCACAQTS